MSHEQYQHIDVAVYVNVKGMNADISDCEGK